MVLIPLPKETLVNSQHIKKALFPIYVTVFGMITCVTLEPAKAFNPIPVTV